MRSSIHDQAREGLADWFRRTTTDGPRGLTTRSRLLEASVSLTQLPIAADRQLRVLRAGGGASEDDIGKFWFVPGYSLVGGPDVVPEQ